MKPPTIPMHVSRMFRVLIPATCLIFTNTLFAQQEQSAQEAGEGTLEEVVVTGIAYGAARAIQAQRDSNTLVTIVSEETLETIPEQSVGEALGRLPGIALLRDRGEAQSITIRGADARLNAVTMNGDRLLSPENTLESRERGKRVAKLDAVPSTLISEIQVFKAVPPNMDGDSIGGAVNVKTKSATELSEPMMDATIRYGYADLPEDDRWSGEFTWGGRLDDVGTWGFIGTVSYETSNIGVSGIEISWDDIDELLDLSTGDTVDLDNDVFVIDDFDIHYREMERDRLGVNATFDWAASDTDLIKFGGWYSEFNTWELRRRLQLRPGGSSDYTTDTTWDRNFVNVNGAVEGGRVRRRHRVGTVDNTTWNLFAEGNHEFGASWFFDWRVSHQEADIVINRDRYRFEARANFIDADEDGIADYTWTGGNTLFPTFTQPDWNNDPNLLEIGRRGSARFWRNEESFDEADSLKLDFTKTLEIQNGTVDMQFGYKHRSRDRDLYPRLFFYDGFRDNPFLMRDAMGANPTTDWRPFGYDNGIFADIDRANQYVASNPLDPDGDTTDEEYHVQEDIDAVYLMGTFNIGNWSTIVGGRWEETSTDIQTYEGTTSSNDYDNFLPAIITKWNFRENSILRAAWTNGLGRPNFSDLKPSFGGDFEYEIDDDTGEYVGTLGVSGGNPLLDPFEAQSFDLSWEHYFEDGGVISLGVFYKEIENFEYREQLRLTDVAISDLPPYLQDIANEFIDDAREDNPDIPADLNTLDRFNYERPVNGDESDMTGWEFNYQQQFVNLPGFWSGFGVFANYTYIDGDSVITQGIERDFVVGQFEDVINFQLFYEVEAWTARLAYNRSGVQFLSLGLDVDDGEVVSDPNEDYGNAEEDFWDFAFQYRWELDNGNQMTFFFDVQNLTDENARLRFFGSGNVFRWTETENIGRSYNVGLRWSL